MGPELNRPNVLTDYAEKLIQIRARQLARRSDFRWTDDEDLAQEMRRQLLRRAHLFDARRGSINTFVVRVIDSWIASLLRERRRQKRARARDAVSLERSRVLSDGVNTTLRETLSANRVAGRHADGPPDELARKQLVAGVASVVGALPPLLRDICTRLPERSLAGIKRELRLSRRQFDKAMAQIRGIFADARLGNPADTLSPDGVRKEQRPRGLDCTGAANDPGRVPLRARTVGADRPG
ncbi:MAG: hypothetical protein L6R00_20830 [Phycisphaerae bacterium]|nr:hypothetical protein [Phycisphaerae bacterium]